DMIEYLDFYEMNIIEGDDGGGKSTLLKKIYKYYLANNIVVFLETEDFIGVSNIEALISKAFKKQYNIDDFDEFYKYDISKRIVIIDNVENRKNWIKILRDKFSKIICSTSTNFKQKVFSILEESTELHENSMIYSIKGFYKRKRTELAVNLYKNLH